MIGEIDGVEVWVVCHQLGARDDVLAKRPVKVWMILGDVEVVGRQV